GKGIDEDSVVRDFAGFKRKVAALDEEFGAVALVEQYLQGREFSVAFLGHGKDLLAMPIELIANQNTRGDRMLGAGIKADDTEQVVAVEDVQTRRLISLLGKRIYRALGGHGYGRIDIRMDEAGN